MTPVPPGSALAREIADLARRDGLVLFVGAGINGKAGLMWGDLLAAILRRSLNCSIEPRLSREAVELTIEEIKKEYDPYAQASIAAMLLGPHRFVPVLRSALYTQGDCDFAALARYCEKIATVEPAMTPASSGSAAFGYLTAIARLCMRPEIECVITLNFDTLLEYAMGCVKRARQAAPWDQEVRTPVPIARQLESRHDQTSRRGLQVYHVHGCLPPPGSLTHLSDYPVVLSQQDYTRTMQDPYSWESSSQLHYLRNYPCLFLGLSMNDWNVLRLLQSAGGVSRRLRQSPRRYCVGVSPDPLRAELKGRLLENFGVSYHTFPGPAYDPLAGFVDQIYAELRHPIP